MSIRASSFATLIAFAAVQPVFNGVWLVEKPQAELKTIDGKAPPLKPEAAALHAKRKQAKQAGSKDADDPVAQCLPQGIPRLLNVAQPIQILQKPQQITVLYQANHQARLFYIDDPLPKADELPDVTYNGTPYARWDGNTFVVETLAFNDQTWLDETGLPHSQALRLVERYQLLDPARIKVTITVTDPETFTAPWDTQVTYRKQPGLRLREDACSEKLWHPGAPPSG